MQKNKEVVNSIALEFTWNFDLFSFPKNRGLYYNSYAPEGNASKNFIT